MSQCFRNVSNKFTTVNSLLNTTRKHATQLDRQLPHRIKPSTFLEEFLNTRTITSAAVSQKCKLQTQHQASSSSSSSSSSSLALLNNCEAWREAFDYKEYDDDTEEERMKIISSINPIMMSGIKKYEISSDDIVSCEKFNSKNILSEDLNSNSNSNSKSLIMYEVESLERTYNRLSNGITMLKTNDSILSDFEKNMILLSENGKLNAQKIDTKQPSVNNEGKPSQEQLQHVYDVLSRTLPSLFIHPLDYSIYHKDVHFVNNIRGTVTRGLLNYVKQMALLRTIGHLRFAYVKFEIIKMTINPEDDSIKIRWRIRGISGLKAFVFFWKVKLWKMSESYEQQELWYDGFSTFHVNADGLVYKHVADKVMPDKDETVETKDQTAVAAKLALFLGLLVPGGETLSEIYPLTSMSRHNNNNNNNNNNRSFKLVTQLNCDKNFLLETDYFVNVRKN